MDSCRHFGRENLVREKVPSLFCDSVRYIIPRRLMDEGFEFCFAELEQALTDLYERKN